MPKDYAKCLKFDFPEMDGDERLRQLILYISDKCEGDSAFGATKLNKILWRSDFWFYAHHGRPITGLEYMKLPHGPAPKRLLPVRNRMERNREIVVREKPGYKKSVQHRVVPLKSPDLSMFSGDEIAMIDSIIDELSGASAKQVSRESHGIAWRVARQKESIPYQAIFLSDDPIGEYDIQRTAELAKEHGW